ncbi:hypothetical protein [Roseimaritima ulvae]|uniref:Uncharacterized protein n=1 Tax=Roseimaritima ulvae TaxID=980254 RepID=A0A5B9QYW8_9BACT|nr:hypothetical protein [Roseimaritima ulvae]QEG43252.1 hypothetical protein UC8_52990 [Roseimaritima ulvae]
MAGTRKRSSVELGHDAFLDIVANLVGILIILVVILGTRSQQVAQEIKAQSQVSNDDMAQLATETARAAAAREASQQLEKQLAAVATELKSRQHERAVLNDLLGVAQAAWEAKQADLDEHRKQAVQLVAAQAALNTELQQLRGQRSQLEASEAPVVSLEHLPTPMAKTVFGEELHFRLKDNLLSVVPVDRLIESIREDFQHRVNGRDGTMASQVGPIQGYSAQYEMSRQRKAVSSGGRVGMATQIQLVGLVIEPLKEPHGQPVEKVFQGRSMLDVELAGRDPATTTITIWVYPDSFASLRKLKEHLYQRGFATAARPLPMGRPISGSPNGSRSSAQ